MTSRFFVTCSLVVALVLLPLGGPELASVRGRTAVSMSALSGQVGVMAGLQAAPIMLVENVGQFAPNALFHAQGGQGALWLADDALWITLLGRESGTAGDLGVNIKLSFVGANPHPHLEAFDRLGVHVSYFIGGDPAEWRPDVPVWGGVRYRDLYPGIDLEIVSEDKHMVQRLLARPGADWTMVRLQVEGAEALALEGDVLRLGAAAGEFTLPLFQMVGDVGINQPRPMLVGNQVLAPFAPVIRSRQSFAAGPRLTISDLLYSTFLSGSLDDSGLSIALDGSGNAYVAGTTLSTDFPTTPGAFDRTHGVTDHNDAFVVKLNPAGTGLLYATYLGGSDDECTFGGYPIVACPVSVDGQGNAYVTGFTHSSDFPTTPGALDRVLGGTRDVFVTKLNPNGSALVYSTFLGGSYRDTGYAVAVDGNGSAYLTGYTESPDFPVTPGALDTSGGNDAFIAKLNPAGDALIYATFLGGYDGEGGQGIVADGSGNAYVAGWTWSEDFPTTPGAFDTACNLAYLDAFVVKLNPAGNALLYSTCLGGAGHDSASALAVDASGFAYVAGSTESSDFPTTSGALDLTLGGSQDAFVARLDPGGTTLVFSTFLGGALNYDKIHAMALDGSGAVYVAGVTVSPDFPTTARAFDTALGGYSDAFVTKLNPDGSTLVYGTFLGGIEGGSIDEYAYGIALDGSRNAYVTGQTGSDDFPTTPDAYDPSVGLLSGWDAFVTKLALPSLNADTHVLAPALVRASPGSVVGIPVQYGNLGAVTATLVSLTATLGGGLSYVDDTASVSPTLDNDMVIWDLPDLAFRDGERFILRVELDSAATAGSRHPLTLTIASAGKEDWPGNNIATLGVVATRVIYLPVVLRNP